MMFSGVVSINQVLAESANAVVALTEIRAFDVGCVLEISAALAAPGTRSERGKLFGEIFGHRRKPGKDSPPTMLRFAVEYPDGRTASLANRQLALAEGPQPEPPLLISYGGLGHDDGSAWMDFTEPLWLWTLPPAQTFHLVVEWPIAGISETRVPLDGAAIAEAARESRPLVDRPAGA
jgi:hypothetical protein